MHKKIIGLYSFLFLSPCVHASEFYTEQFILSNQPPHLHIVIPRYGIAAGPLMPQWLILEKARGGCKTPPRKPTEFEKKYNLP